MIQSNPNLTKLFFYFFIFLNFSFLNFSFFFKKFFFIALKQKKIFSNLQKKTLPNITYFLSYKPTASLFTVTQDPKKKLKNKKDLGLNPFFYSQQKFFFFKLLSLLTVHSFQPVQTLFPRTFYFNFFYFHNHNSKEIILNVNKLLQRWLDSFNLISNFFYYQLTPMCYSSPLMKSETLSFNWYYSLFEFSMWKYSYTFFVYKTNRFDRKISFFYDKMKNYNSFFFLIVDVIYHFKNIYYFKKNSFYTVGLMPLNINPWLVQYPVFTSSHSYLNQILFFKFILFSSKQILMIKYCYFKKMWKNVFNKSL